MDEDRYQIQTVSGADVDGFVLIARVGNTMWSILDEVCSAADIAFAEELVDMANRGCRNLTHDAGEIADWLEDLPAGTTLEEGITLLRAWFCKTPGVLPNSVTGNASLDEVPG